MTMFHMLLWLLGLAIVAAQSSTHRSNEGKISYLFNSSSQIDFTKWNDFRLLQLSRVFSVSADQLLSMEISAGRNGKISTYYCSNSTEIKALTLGLLQATNGTNTIAPCNHTNWNVFDCSGEVAICMNNCTSSASTKRCGSWAASPDPLYTFSQFFSLELRLLTRPTVSPSVTIYLLKFTSNSVLLRVATSSPGMVRCAAFPTQFVLTNLSSLRQHRPRAVLPGSLRVNVSLVDLTPSSVYNVYCHLEALDGSATPLESVISSSLEFETSCCPSFQFLTAPKISSVSAFFTFSLDARPDYLTKKTVDGRVIVDACDDGTFQSGIATPDTFSFVSILSGRQTNSFSVSGDPGCYNVTVVSSGNVLQSKTVQVEILGLDSTKIPKLSKAEFSNNGLQLVITFDIDTDQGSFRYSNSRSVFSCGQYLSFVGASLVLCRWQSPRELLILDTSKSTFVYGTQIVLLEGVVRGLCGSKSCSSSTTNLISNVPITVPASFTYFEEPLVALTCSSHFTEDAFLIMDTSTTTGNAGRPWSKISWVVRSVTIDVTSDAANATSWLNKRLGVSNWQPEIRLPRGILRPGQYIISLTLTNFLGAASSDQCLVTVQREQLFYIPSILIVGAKFRSISAHDRISLAVITGLPNGELYEESTYSIQWSVFRGDDWLANVMSESLEDAVFDLPGGVLLPGATYSIVAILCEANRVVGTSTAAVYVTQPEITTVISGTATRTLSLRNNATLLEAKVLDSYSREPQDSPFQRIIWTCGEVFPRAYEACAGYTVIEARSLKVSANVLLNRRQEEYVSFQFVASCIDAGLTSCGSATVALEVFRTLLSLPDILLDKESVAANKGEPLALSCTISLKVPSKLIWASVNPLQPSPFMTSTVFSAKPGAYSFPLILQTSKMTSGLTYQFFLTVASLDANSVTIRRSLTVSLNSAPVGGKLLVSPRSGIERTSIFSFQTVFWCMDVSSLPLSYKFEYNCAGNSSFATPRILLVRSWSPDAAVWTKLSLCGHATSFLTAVITARNHLGASANSSTPFQLWPLVSRPSNTALIEQLRFAAIRSPAGFLTQLELAGQSARSVNCSVPTPCGRLNRYDCSELENTCGKCLAGFSGQALSNAPCVDSKLLKRNLYSPCIANSNCSTSYCLKGKCLESPKKCANDCSNRGICAVVDWTGDPISYCAASSSTCRVECRCASGFYGNDCQYTAGQRHIEANFTESACLLLQLTFPAIQHQSSSNAFFSALNTLWLPLLPTNTADPLSRCVDASLSATSNSSALTWNVEGRTDEIYQYADNLIRRSSADKSSGFWNTSAATFLMSAIAASTHAAASTSTVDSPLYVVSDEFRFSSFRVRATSPLGIVRLPLQASEADNVLVITPSISVVPPDPSDADVVGVDALLLLFHRNALPIQAFEDTNISSPAIFVKLKKVAIQSARRMLLASVSVHFNVTIPNFAPIDYIYPSIFSGVGNCNRTTVPYNITLPCSEGDHIVNCNGTLSTFSFVCQYKTTEPRCQRWDSSSGSFQETEDCYASSYSSNATVCSCRSEKFSEYLVARTVTVVHPMIRKHNYIRVFNYASVSRSPAVFWIMISVLAVWLILTVVVSIRLDLSSKKTPLQLTTPSNSKWSLQASKREMQSFIQCSVSPVYSSDSSVLKKLYRIFLRHHAWMAGLRGTSSYQYEDFQRLAQSLAVLPTIVSIAFVNTCLVVFIFGESASNPCGNVRNLADCTAVKFFDGASTRCVWDAASSTCSYNRNLGHNAISIVIMACVVAGLAYFLINVFRWLLPLRMWARLADRVERWLLRFGTSELALHSEHEAVGEALQKVHGVQSKAGCCLRGARLASLGRFDCLDKHDRVKFLQSSSMQGACDDIQLWEEISKSDAAVQAEAVKFRSRNDSLFQNVQIWRKFLSGFRFGSPLESVFSRSMMSFTEDMIGENVNDWDGGVKAVLGALVGVAMAGSTLYLCWTVPLVSLPLWLIGLSASLAMESLVFNSLEMLVLYFFLPIHTCADLFANVGAILTSRVNLILLRRFGLMRKCWSRHQLLNAGCRLARQFPALTLSRILLSLNPEEFHLIGQEFESAEARLSGLLRRFLSLDLFYQELAIGAAVRAAASLVLGLFAIAIDYLWPLAVALGGALVTLLLLTLLWTSVMPFWRPPRVQDIDGAASTMPGKNTTSVSFHEKWRSFPHLRERQRIESHPFVGLLYDKHCNRERGVFYILKSEAHSNANRPPLVINTQVIYHDAECNDNMSDGGMNYEDIVMEHGGEADLGSAHDSPLRRFRKKRKRRVLPQPPTGIQAEESLALNLKQILMTSGYQIVDNRRSAAAQVPKRKCRTDYVADENSEDGCRNEVFYGDYGDIDVSRHSPAQQLKAPSKFLKHHSKKRVLQS